MWHGGDSMARTSRTIGEHRAGCSKRLSSKAAASEEARRTLRYVERLSDARTLLADFFSILLEQKSRDHSDEDRSSYPYMLLKHVEGSGSRQGLSKLQGLP